MFTLSVSVFISQCLFHSILNANNVYLTMLKENAVYQKVGQPEKIIIHPLHDILK